MTDYQEELLQKMLRGEIAPWLHTAKIVFCEHQKNGAWYLISEQHTHWADYDIAWKMYESLPLVKALE